MNVVSHQVSGIIKVPVWAALLTAIRLQISLIHDIKHQSIKKKNLTLPNIHLKLLLSLQFKYL